MDFWQSANQNKMLCFCFYFHLTSGASTADIVQRNKALTPSQLTLREEFVEKKYQVFDIIGVPGV